MTLRLAWCLVLLALAACGGPKGTTQEQICGPRGCDMCIGLACTFDAGTDGGTP